MFKNSTLILIFIWILFPQTAESRYFSNCGTYKVIGVLKIKRNRAILRIFEDSRSEIDLRVKNPNNLDLKIYMDKEVSLSGKIQKKIKNYGGEISVNEIELNVPDPLAPNKGHGFWLKQTHSCK